MIFIILSYVSFKTLYWDGKNVAQNQQITVKQGYSYVVNANIFLLEKNTYLGLF